MITKLRYVGVMLLVMVVMLPFANDVMAQSSGVGVVVDYPLEDYDEPRVGTMPDRVAWRKVSHGLNLTWASRDVHYSLHEVPQVESCRSMTLRVWKGERAGVQALIYSKRDEGVLGVRTTGWWREGVAMGIPIEARFVNYVITDDYKACGDHPSNLEPWLVADVIDVDKPRHVPAMETRPVWCIVEVPRDVEAGEYSSELQVVDERGRVVESLELRIVVVDRTLLEVHEQRFHLDLWQQPYAVSRYHGVERWSEEHIDALRPYLMALGRAGQCTVSAILFYEPWGRQTHVPDRFEPMVQTIRTAEGEWRYDYTIFDRYVELCEECGISKQINCFSMVPWDMSFRYYDEATMSYNFLQTTTNTPEYYDLWCSFLEAFKAHLIEKGWFDKTCIAMDERSEEDMQCAYAIAHSLGFRMALAGNYHRSLVDKLNDYCVAYDHARFFTAEERALRRDRGYVTTFYTSCADREPNIYSNSLPSEAAFLPIYAAAVGVDGYLHWSWINWAEEPLADTRYRLFGAGDTYFYYPGNRSSIRFERLVEGIHQYEKIQIIRNEYRDDPQCLAELDALLEPFLRGDIKGEECAKLVGDIENFLNRE
jgi:hypothetical protein